MEGGSGFRFAPKATVGHQDVNLSLCARTAPQQQGHYSLIDAGKHGRRHCETERPGCNEVDD